MSESKPSVTVLIPCYNTAPYLRATLESVLQQSLAPKEIILVDDGSGDGTLEIIQEFAQLHSLIKVIAFERNRGVVAARNAALLQATGEYVAMLDGDDIWTEDALEARVALAQQFPNAHLIATDFAWFDVVPAEQPVGRIALGPRGRSQFADSFVAGEPILLEDPFGATARTHFVWTGATLIKRSALSAAGNFDASFDGPEDTLLWLRLAQRGAFVFSPRITAHYRQRAGSLVTQLKGPKEFHYLKVLARLGADPQFRSRRGAVAELSAECHYVASLYYQHRKEFRTAIKHAAKAALLQPTRLVYWRNVASSGAGIMQPGHAAK